MRTLATFVAGLICGAALVWVRQEPPQTVFAPCPATTHCPAPVASAPAIPAEPQPPAASRIPPPIESPPAPAAARAPDRGLLIPVAGVEARELSDTFSDRRSQYVHEAIDIMAPRGTPVLAAADGRIVKLFNSVPGGLTIYQFDPAERFSYYYAHLDRYAPGLAEGQAVTRGQVIAFVGSTGNASLKAPHLHFALFELGPEKRWWEGKAINPYPLFEGVDIAAAR